MCDPPLAASRSREAASGGEEQPMTLRVTLVQGGGIGHDLVPAVQRVLAAAGVAIDWDVHPARAAGRKLIHCVHKANILKLSDGLTLEAFRAVAKDYPDLQTKEIIVDNCCMQMVLKPQQFDTLVMGNLYGDIVSDLGAGVVGGISATAAINVGEGVRVYETFHGGSREQIGVNRANPLPLLLPAIDLLDAVGQKERAQRLLTAVENGVAAGQGRTPDLRGHSTTTAVADADRTQVH